MPSSVSDSDDSSNGDKCESSGVVPTDDAATSSNLEGEETSSAGEGENPFQQQVAACFQDLRLKSVKHCRAEAPKLITENHAKIRQWFDSMQVQERQQGGQPALPALPKASASLLSSNPQQAHNSPNDGGNSSDDDAGAQARRVYPTGPQKDDVAARKALTFVPRRQRKSGGGSADRVFTNNASASDRMPMACAAAGGCLFCACTV
ncbi:hypothetical protein DUNSADRAFT_919 [Dunaliella salina]|uniref:Encoded protein n=1 Tax=Dunaliella salina TaxID=3046 RepID=A0ABQ7H8R7_DUNSA|nr:hypothetical protein DUNSADRAFT_919 [Dunaliella salina]|eukprot:KAF5843244.1 hypothetical protein DUNSADRAFT_919 [Dunaliella salina]